MYECTDLGVHCKDERGYVTKACVFPLLLFRDEIKIIQEF